MMMLHAGCIGRQAHLSKDLALKGRWAGQQRFYFARGLIPKEQLPTPETLVGSLQNTAPPLLRWLELPLCLHHTLIT